MPDAVDSILGPDGPIAGALGADFEARDEQQRMARAVARAMAQRGRLLVEAGTGVGKSFAYLVPAILRCLAHGETVVVATNTISLQEQLIERDVPLLVGTLGLQGAPEAWAGELRPVLVKGRGNYLSIRRLALASERAVRQLPDAASRRSLQVIQEWAYATRDGTLSTLPPLERPGVWNLVQSDSGNCMGRKCPNYRQCFYQAARRQMEEANLLICNHALFFADLALRARNVGFLPKYDHVVLDEAHNVEDVAAEHFGLSLSEGRVFHLLGMLHHPRAARGYLAQLDLSVGDTEAVSRTVSLVMRADTAAREFFGSLAGAHQRSDSRNGRVRRPGVVENVLTPAMNELAVRLRSLRDDVKSEADRFELNAYAERAGEIADTAEALIEQTAAGCVYWIESRRPDEQGRHGATRVTLACSPVDVAPLLRERLFEGQHSVVLTSATLATRTVRDDEPAERAETAFAHAISRLGCEGAPTLQLGSPFDYARQIEVFVDRSMPSPRAGDEAAAHGDDVYTRELVSRILDHVSATEGGAFVLFTSFGSLYRAADALRSSLRELGLPLLVQGRDGSRRDILLRFREDGRSVLLGAASFWQGVDVRGHALRNVIITRLPFEPPDRPLTEARLDLIRERGGDPFRDDSLPRAVLRFKQGFGRLVRSATDRGRVVVLDPRILTTGYGRHFLAALPEGVPLRVLPVQADDPAIAD